MGIEAAGRRIHRLTRLREVCLGGGDGEVTGHRLMQHIVERLRLEQGPPIVGDLFAERKMLRRLAFARRRRIGRAIGLIGLLDRRLGLHEIGTEHAAGEERRQADRRRRPEAPHPPWKPNKIVHSQQFPAKWAPTPCC
jgi:hypothetical protein